MNKEVLFYEIIKKILTKDNYDYDYLLKQDDFKDELFRFENEYYYNMLIRNLRENKIPKNAKMPVSLINKEKYKKSSMNDIKNISYEENKIALYKDYDADIKNSLGREL